MQGRNRTITRLARIFVIGAAMAMSVAAFASTGTAAEKPVHLTVRTRPAYGVEQYEAMLAGWINPHGSTATYRFQWGLTKHYGHLAPEWSPEEPVYPGYEGEEIEEFIDGLSPHTLYHFRFVAYSHGKKVFGQDETFKTWRVHPSHAG